MKQHGMAVCIAMFRESDVGVPILACGLYGDAQDRGIAAMPERHIIAGGGSDARQKVLREALGEGIVGRLVLVEAFRRDG